MASGTESPDTAAPARRDRTHWLYISVIVAVVLGIIVGFVFPDFAVSLKWLGTAFVALIRMLIAPVIFCTIVLGIGAIRKAASVGRIGGLALAYFLAMSTVALAIGLVVGNLLHPGDGLQLSDELRGQGSSLATEAEGSGGTTDFVLSLIPKTLLSSLTEGIGAPGPARGAAGRFRDPVDGPVRRAAAARRRVPAEARLPGARDGHVGGPDRCLRRDRRGRRRDRMGRPQEPGPAH